MRFLPGQPVTLKSDLASSTGLVIANYSSRVADRTFTYVTVLWQDPPRWVHSIVEYAEPHLFLKELS